MARGEVVHQLAFSKTVFHYQKLNKKYILDRTATILNDESQRSNISSRAITIDVSVIIGLVMKLNLALCIVCVFALSGCSTVDYSVRFEAEPDGASLVCGGQNNGTLPRTLHYDITKEHIQNGSFNIVKCFAIWPSGSKIAYGQNIPIFGTDTPEWTESFKEFFGAYMSGTRVRVQSPNYDVDLANAQRAQRERDLANQRAWDQILGAANSAVQQHNAYRQKSIENMTRSLNNYNYNYYNNPNNFNQNPFQQNYGPEVYRTQKLNDQIYTIQRVK